MFDEIISELDKQNNSDEVFNALFNMLDDIAARRDKAKGIAKRHIRNAGERIEEALNALDEEPCDFNEAIKRIKIAQVELEKVNDNVKS